MAVEKVGQDETVKIKAVCKNCGAVLEFYRKDVKTQSLYSMGEYDGSYDYVDCPECNNRVTVDNCTN